MTGALKAGQYNMYVKDVCLDFSTQASQGDGNREYWWEWNEDLGRNRGEENVVKLGGEREL